jgi:hypothetical protein
MNGRTTDARTAVQQTIQIQNSLIMCPTSVSGLYNNTLTILLSYGQAEG